MSSKKLNPPRWAAGILRWFCSREVAEEIEGDLQEEFDYQVQLKGASFARRDYVRNVAGYIFTIKRAAIWPGGVRPILVRHYFLVAVRNLARHKSFSFINIVGLALGMSACLGIIMLISENMMYDKYNTKGDRIYRIVSANDQSNRATTPFPLVDELIEKYPGIEKSVRFNGWFGNIIGFKLLENTSIPVAGLFASPEVFEVLEYELEFGDPSTALRDPFTAVLTKATARKLFKEVNPLGETIQVGNAGAYKVTGILKETNRKSHIQFEALASLASVKSLEALGKSSGPMGFRETSIEAWQALGSGWTYILLQEGRSPQDVETALASISAIHYSNLTPGQEPWKFHLQKLTEITPGRGQGNEIGPVLDDRVIYLVSCIALAILGTAGFNFTNLSIARSLSRSKEIGVRKVTGASRWQIFFQFLFESILIAWLSLILAFVLILGGKQFFLDLSLIRMIQWDLAVNGYVLMAAFGFATCVGILAGLFPAALLSQLAPVKVLRNLSNLKIISKTSVRKVLITSQFAVALIFVLSTIIVYEQVNLFLHKDHGFNMKNNIMLKLNQTKFEPLKVELSKSSNIGAVSAASYIPATFVSNAWGYFKTSEEVKDWSEIRYYSVDADYLENMDVPLIAGRFFSSGAGNSNRNFVVLNEQALAEFHFASPAEALGQSLLSQNDSLTFEIIGIIKDYNHSMLTQKINPMMLMYRPEQYGVLQVKYSGDYAEAARVIEETWSKINPSIKIDYAPIDAEVSKFYDLILGDLVKMLLVIACFAVIICCLGLLGIVNYATGTRFKEISIRKIFGSSDVAIVFLLSRGFAMMMIVAVAIGLPIAYLINNFWLQNIAYRTSIDAGVITWGISSVLLVGGLTIASQTVKASRIRPVHYIKAE